MNSNLEMMLDSVILESVKNSIINENRLEKEGKWSVYLLYNGVGVGEGEGGDISGITPSIYIHPNQHPDWCGGHI